MASISIELSSKPRGFHLITEEIQRALSEAVGDNFNGICHLFLKHTSASLTINENASPDVREDMEAALNRIAPEGSFYKHSEEGPDDMPAHVKSSLLGCSLIVPIENSRLSLGTWQGIYLGEHRDIAGSRIVLATLIRANL